MKKNPAQLEFDFEPKAVAVSNRFSCDHEWCLNECGTREACHKCGLLVDHEYIIEKLSLSDWPSDEL